MRWRTISSQSLAVVALMSAAAALPRPVAALEGVECVVVLAVGDSPAIASLGYSLNYSATSGGIAGHGADPECSNLIDGSLASFFDNEATRVLHGGFIAQPAVAASRDLVSCIYRGADAPLTENFVVVVKNADDDNAIAINPLPVVEVKSVDCVPTNSLTTTSTSTTTSPPTTTTTLSVPSDCQDWTMRVHLDSSLAPVGGLRVNVDYVAASGGFPGLRSSVNCEGLVENALYAVEDVDEERLLRLAMVTTNGVSAPADFVSCVFRGYLDSAPVVEDFTVTVEESVDVDANPVSATASVSLEILDSGQGCVDTCGDGIVHESEACDDGNGSNSDECLNNCSLAICGDAVVHSGVEACDDGNTSNADACLAGCVAATCGDAMVHAGVEQCDDGNPWNYDFCLTNCRVPICGDGFLRPGIEQCDDGNAIQSDGCLSSCKTASCGDGFVRLGREECDDGGVLDGDGCTSKCFVEVLCGDAVADAQILASDALWILRHAVGLSFACPLWSCDVNDSGTVTAMDALTVLRTAVGLPTTRTCPQRTS